MHNPNVSDQAKEHPQATVEESGSAQSTRRASDDKPEGNNLRRHKVSTSL